MRTMDFSPLFRHSVGFDRIQHMLDSAARAEQSQSYPPYNIEQFGEDGYQITLAVAGFSEADLDITLSDRSLIVSGKVEQDEVERTFLHRGIAGRAFERRFELADQIQVGGAKLENGLLHISLKRVIPDEQKPRKISITDATGVQEIEQKNAA